MPLTNTDHPVCVECGRTNAMQIGERWLCADCISVAGSCCAEFGARDACSTDDPGDKDKPESAKKK